MSEKYLTDPDEYVCKLSKETQEIAKEQLREDDYTRRHALSALRQWMIQNPRIQICRFDSNFLLKFLRFKKFSLPLTQECLERYLLLRQTYERAFRNLDMNLSKMMELIDRGLATPVPGRDYLGRRIVVVRCGELDPYRYTNEDLCRITGIICETLLMDEENQVRGLVYFADGKGVGLPHLTLFTPREAVRIVKNGEKTIPVRHKELHGINCHPSLKFAVDWGFSLVSDKIKKRVKIYSNMEEVYENLDRNLLPKEYGGNMPLSEMIELWKEEVRAARNSLLLSDKMSVNLELFSEKAKIGAVSALKQGNTCKSANNCDLGIIGSFKKLEVD